MAINSNPVKSRSDFFGTILAGSTKMKKQNGFIQIPLLIAIIAGVLVLGGGGYFGVKQYQSYQAEKIEKEKIAQEAQQQKDSEVEKLKQEVEALKNKKPEIKKTFTTSEIVLFNKKFVVSVSCQTGTGNVYGSGVIIGKSNANLIVLTNYHVTKYAKVPPAGVPPCVVADASLPEFYYGQPVYYPNIASQTAMNTIDFAFVEVRGPIPNEVMYYDESTGKFVGSEPSTPKTTLLSINVFPKICAQNSMRAGEEIVVLGYPTIGGEFDFGGPNFRLITTEGIISSAVRSFDNYFVSSAKIEQGNSGGGAFLKSENCLAGMPTYVQIGEIESLGRLINMPKLKNDYLSKIFGSL